MTIEVNEKIEIITDLIKDKATSEDSLKEYCFSLLAEMYWLNFRIRVMLEKEFQDIVFKDEDQKEIMISQVSLTALTSLLLARNQAALEYNSFSRSVCFH